MRFLDERRRKTQRNVTMEGKLNGNFHSDVNTWAVSRGQNELIGKFKMVAGDEICIGGVGYEEQIHSNRN